MPRRAGRWAFLFLLFGAFLATVGEAADDVVPVPDVKDRPLAEARQALTAAGFLVAEAETSGQPEGTVLAQVPAPNAPTPRGAVVLLEVRRATAATQTPRATGLGVAEAMAALGSLYVIELEATTGAAADKGKVVGQVPAMGATLPLRGVLRLRYVPDTTVDPRVAVPDVSGLSSAEAAQALADAGLHARSATLVTSGVPPDLTVGQLPLPGTEVPRFSTVVLVVSVAGEEAAPGAPDVEVPNVTGMSESSARAELDRVSLGASVEWIDGDPSQAFLVAMQEPAAGESVAAGAEVALRIVRYAPPVPPTPTPTVRVAVPNLVGMSQVQAEDLLAHLGLLGAPVLAPRPGVPALRVFSQNLTAGRWVDPGTVVGYRVAEPPPPPGPIPVPNFFGQTHGGALGLAAQAGLSLQVLEVVTNAHAPHRIYSQSAPAWTWLPPGSQVTVKLARPLVLPPTAVVPSLAGKTPGQAMALLAAAGLTGSRTDVFTLQHPPLRVFAQAPAPGASVPVGTLVAYKVAKAGLDVRQVPHLGGKTKAQAIAAIQARGLVADVQFEVAPGKPLGLVFWQSPSPNALRPAGSTVHAKVAKPLLVVVPTVVGLPVNAAKAALEAVGLAHAVMLAPAPGQPAGKVWDQAPNAGASLAPGTVVTLRVPGPVINPGLVKVPNLIGLAPLAAKMALVSKGLVSDGKMIPAPFKPHDRVYSQSLAPNTFVASGTKVVWRWNP